MQSPALVVSRDRYGIDSLEQGKPTDLKLPLLNAAAADRVKGGSMAGLNFFPATLVSSSR